MSENITERNELADLLADSIFRYTGVTTSSSKSMADELLAAGYRKPRTVTTVEDVEALPEGTKLYSPQTTHSWELRDLSTHGGVRVTGTGGGYTHIRDFIKYEAPLEVLHEPNQS